MIGIVFKIVSHNSLEYYKAIKLREEVLRKPLGFVCAPEEAEKEKDHIHIAGFNRNEIISTAVLVPKVNECKMQRVAVNSGLQSVGIGSRMVEFCENYAKEHEFHSIYCYARDTAVNFYLKNCYVSEGGYFSSNTIPHLKLLKMRKWL